MQPYSPPPIPFTEHLITATNQGRNMRIDKFLSDTLAISRTKVQNALANGWVIVNEKRIKSNYIVQPSDMVVASIPQEVGLEMLTPEPIPLDIVYEDEHLLVVHKPAQMVVHPDTAHKTGTLAHALLYRYRDLPLKDDMASRPGLVHRIDKNTSGLLVVAKTVESLVGLSTQFYNHTVKRIYYTLVWGNPQNDAGTIDCNVGKNSHNHQKISVFPDHQQGKKAITHYKVIKRLHHVALVACKLETGRTHQIRVHMQHIGHPVFGDSQYGGDQIVSGQRYASYKAFVQNCFKCMPYHALHAAVLGFTHPITQMPLSFTADLPENFLEIIKKWEKYIHFSNNINHVTQHQTFDPASLSFF